MYLPDCYGYNGFVSQLFTVKLLKQSRYNDVKSL